VNTPGDAAPIAALASGRGPAGVAVLRLSGRDCHTLLAQCLRLRTKAWPVQALRRADLIDPASGELIDDLLAKPNRSLVAEIPGTAKDGGPSCATVKPPDGWKVVE